MFRTMFSALVILGLVSLVGLGWDAAPARAESQIALTYANFPPAPTFPCVQMERWKTEVEKRTKGKVKVQTFPGSTLLNPKNMLDGVVSGVADIGCFAMSYQPGRFPVSQAIDLPWGFPDARTASLTLFDLVMKYQPKEFREIKLITLFTCAPTHFMTSTPVKSPADLKGLELRAAGTSVDVVRRLGGTAIGMPQSEVPEAMQKGTVKGLISSLEVLEDMNYAAYCPYVTTADLPVITFAVVMNKRKWDQLPADVRKVIDELARPHAEWTGRYEDDHVKHAIEYARKKYKLQVFALPQTDQEKTQELLKPMFDDYLKKAKAAGVDGEAIIAEIKALKAKNSKKGLSGKRSL